MLKQGFGFVLLMVMLTACGNIQIKEKLSKLNDSLTRYSAAVRWARYLDAYDYHFGQDGSRPKLDLEKYKGIEVTGYDVIEKTANEDQTEVFVVAVISYYNENVGTVNQYKHLQTWWYREESKAWLLDANLPDLK